MAAAVDTQFPFSVPRWLTLPSSTSFMIFALPATALMAIPPPIALPIMTKSG
ncbi:hypothetical protein D3C86_2196430 [compost metagenome]